MQECATVQQCLPPLASAFCLPSEGIAYPRRIDRILAGGEHTVTAIFPHVRDALAHGASAYDPLEMQALQGVVGTGITLLAALVETADERGVDAARRAKLHSLLEEYQKLLEDIELFSGDISAADCLLATGSGILRSELETAEENAVWSDL